MNFKIEDIQKKYANIVAWIIILSEIILGILYNLKMIYENVSFLDFYYDLLIGVFGASFSVWIAHYILFEREKTFKHAKRKRYLFKTKIGIASLMVFLNEINSKVMYEIESNGLLYDEKDEIVSNTIELIELTDKTNCEYKKEYESANKILAEQVKIYANVLENTIKQIYINIYVLIENIENDLVFSEIEIRDLNILLSKSKDIGIDNDNIFISLSKIKVFLEALSDIGNDIDELQKPINLKASNIEKEW